VKINNLGTLFACFDLKIHKELKLLELNQTLTKIKEKSMNSSY
jgi:hypothetical protein